MANYGISRSKPKQRAFLAKIIKRERKFKPGMSDYFRAHKKFNSSTRESVGKIAGSLRRGNFQGMKKKLSGYHGTKY